MRADLYNEYFIHFRFGMHVHIVLYLKNILNRKKTKLSIFHTINYNKLIRVKCILIIDFDDERVQFPQFTFTFLYQRVYFAFRHYMHSAARQRANSGVFIYFYCILSRVKARLGPPLALRRWLNSAASFY